MDTRGAPSPDRPAALPDPAEPVADEKDTRDLTAETIEPEPLDWASDDTLSEFPAEEEVGRGAGSPPVEPSIARWSSARWSSARWRIALAVALIAALAAGGWWWWRGRSGAPANTGTLTVASSPAGASVFVDGRERGTTPLTLAVAAGTHSVTLRGPNLRRELKVAVAAGAQVVHHVELGEAVPTSGRLRIAGPAGAPVAVDGTPHGVTPAELGIPAGDHVVTVGKGASAVTQKITVPAGGVASVLVPAPQASARQAHGWITVVAPIELQVFDGDTLIGSSTTRRILVLAGRHNLRLVNSEFGYQATRTVDVDAAGTANVRITPPNGVLHVNAVPWADVLVDGRRVGQTPIANLAVPIGTHEVTLRHPKFGEQKRSIVISLAAPTRVGVDLRQ